MNNKLKDELIKLKDEKSIPFQAKLMPTVQPDTILGIKTPVLKNMAKNILNSEEADIFMSNLPHEYFEENQIHAFLISFQKDYDKCMRQLNFFLPFIDNWATCDQMSPICFKKNPEKILPFIDELLKSDKTYYIRFGIGMLMRYFLDDRFNLNYAEKVAKIKSDEYYVNMMIAWYFATALAKQYESIIPFIENKRLDVWVYKKTIRKALESYRIPKEHKDYLRKFSA